MKNLIEKQCEEYFYFCEAVKGQSPTTMRSKRYNINRFIKFSGVKSLEEITNKQINDWMASMTERGISGRSVNDAMMPLVAMLRWQKDMGATLPNVRLGLIVKRKELPPRQVYFPREKVDEVLKYADQAEWLMIKLCFECGLRVTELASIQLADIEGKKIQIVGKGGYKRFVFIDDEMENRLKYWIKRTGAKKYLWPTSLHGQETPMNSFHVRRRMKLPFERAGINNFYPHALRHSFATDLQRNGASIGEIKIALGHKHEGTTERYMHNLDGYDAERIWNQYKFQAA